MKVQKTRRKRQKEAGIALLIAIFILLLIGVAAIALVVSSGTESALAGNYRSSTSVYYAAVAGLEEARSRLRSNNPNSFSNLPPGSFLPPPGTPLAAHAKQVAQAVASGGAGQVVGAVPPAFRARLAQGAHQAFISGFNTIILVAFAVAVVGSLAGYVLVRSSDFVASGPALAPEAKPVAASA